MVEWHTRILLTKCPTNLALGYYSPSDTWILHTKFPKSHPLAILLTPWGFKTLFLKRERKILQRLHPSDAHCCSVTVNTADRSDCNTLESLCTLPTIHDQVLLQTRPWRGFPLVAPLPSGSNRAKNLQMLVPR